MTSRLSLLGVCALATSCGYASPYQSSGPAISKAGVEIRLTGERCYVNRSGEQFPTTVDDDRLHVEVNLQIANTSSKPAQVALNHFELAEGAQAERVVMAPSEADVLTVSPNETRTVALDFEKGTSLDCRHDFSLFAKDAVILEGRPVDVAAIDFQPAR